MLLRLVEEVRLGLDGGMAARAKQDVDSGAVAQSIVDSRGPAANNNRYRYRSVVGAKLGSESDFVPD